MHIRAIITWPLLIAIALVWISHKVAKLFSRVSTGEGDGSPSNVLATPADEPGDRHIDFSRIVSEVTPS